MGVRMAWLKLIAFTGVVISGAAVAQDQAALTPKQADHARAAETGSLWSDQGYQSFLYYDRKAKGVGDLVTIKIVEASQASRSATTSLDRQSSVSAGVNALMGLETSIVEAKPNIKPSALLGATTGNQFKGDGATTSSGSLTATVTARVVKVLENGNLVVHGEQQVKINHEVQILSIRGIVRPEDIQINNVVLSTFIADARIEYAGNGVVSEKQKPGWLSRTVDRVWPF